MPLIRSSGQGPARRGAVIPLVAVCLIGVVGVLAIAVDGGVLLAERRHAQAVADAAARAGASDLCQRYATYLGTDPQGTAKKSAQDAASLNGYTTAVTDITTFTSAGGGVQVNIPPQSGPAVNKSGYVEALVKYNEGRSFSNIFAAGLLPVNARSVATGRVTGNVTAGILLLDPTGQGALSYTGISVGVKGAPIIVNSSNSQAVTGSGKGQLSASEIDITGKSPGYNVTGGATLQGTVSVGRATTADPLANLPTPDPSTMTVRSSTGLSVSGGTQTLSPGVYQGGISISSSSNVTLLPGVYYMDGGGFTISGQANVTANGVMIYNAPQSSKDVISLTGQGAVTLTPPTSGTYQSLTLFQDRSSSNTVTVAGGSTTDITGSFYFAGATLSVTGGSSTASIGSQYISKDLTLSGHGSLAVDATGPTATTQRTVGLVE